VENKGAPPEGDGVRRPLYQLAGWLEGRLSRVTSVSDRRWRQRLRRRRREITPVTPIVLEYSLCIGRGKKKVVKEKRGVRPGNAGGAIVVSPPTVDIGEGDDDVGVGGQIITRFRGGRRHTLATHLYIQESSGSVVVATHLQRGG